MFDQRVVVRSRKAQESEGRAGLAYLYPSFGVVAIVVLFVGVTSFRIKGEAASSIRTAERTHVNHAGQGGAASTKRWNDSDVSGCYHK